MFVAGSAHGEPTRTTTTSVKNELLDYVDHRRDPNAVFVIWNVALVALRPIHAGQAVTFFYPGAEIELARDFDCKWAAARAS